jgi:divalent anion:Na+ symporter, DASS family
VFQGAVVISAMFLTSMAANPLAAQIVGEMGVTISWMKWAVAAIVPGILSLIAIPWVVSKVAPPGIKATPEAPKMAKEKLAEMGKMKRNEWLMAGTFGVVFVLWLFGEALGVSAVTAACVGLVGLLVTGVLRWKDCLEETTAWDTLFWLGSLIMMGSALKKLGLFVWITGHLGGLAVLPAIPLLGLLVLVYFYAHYFFASNVAHLSAMFAAFVALAMGMGAPAMLTALVFSFSSALFGGLTHYGCGPAPVYFGAGAVKMGKWWLVGLIVSVVNIIIWGGVGSLWWKFLGYW